MYNMGGQLSGRLTRKAGKAPTQWTAPHSGLPHAVDLGWKARILLEKPGKLLYTTKLYALAPNNALGLGMKG